MRQASSYIVTCFDDDTEVPQKLQNLSVREYARKNQITVGLSKTELGNGKNLSVLRSLLGSKQSDVILFSKRCLLVNPKEGHALLKDFILNGGTVHFSLEEEKISTFEVLENLLDDLMVMKKQNDRAFFISDTEIGEEVYFLQTNHHSTKNRKYRERACSSDRVECMKVASMYGKDYWDGDRRFGYGGYHYDGRWAPVARELAKFYQLDESSKVLDVGCGKGYLLYEIKKIFPQIKVFGVDRSEYAIACATELLGEAAEVGFAQKLPFLDRTFDLVISLNCLHNLELPSLSDALSEIERVKKGHSWICVESYRNLSEKVNLLDWQLTCESFYSTKGWEFLFRKFGYQGDYEFIYFE